MFRGLSLAFIERLSKTTKVKASCELHEKWKHFVYSFKNKTSQNFLYKMKFFQLH